MSTDQSETAIVAAVARDLGTTATAASRLPGGHSTDNWRIDLASGPPVVARRYHPERSVCAIEAALLERLAGVAPVPEVVRVDAEGSLTGTPLLVTTFVDGVSAADVVEGGAVDDVAGVAGAAGTALAAIGSVAFPAPGFFSGGDLAVEPIEPGIDGALAWIHATLDRADTVDPALRAAWWRHVVDTASAVDRRPRPAALTHSDYNPKNILVRRLPTTQGWEVAAVLDWEFAYAGDPVTDVGNWLRFAHEQPPAYADRFVAGYRAAGGDLPDDWAARAVVLDAMALADFLAGGPRRAYYDHALRLVALAAAL